MTEDLSTQLQRTLGVSYKTAWYLSHRIRDAMGSVEESPLVGVVEVDETLIGGKVEGEGRGYRENKSVVIGAIQRGGNVRLRVIPNMSASCLSAPRICPRCRERAVKSP